MIYLSGHTVIGSSLEQSLSEMSLDVVSPGP